MNAVQVRSVPRLRKRRRRRFLREAKIPLWVALILIWGMFISLLSTLLRAFEFWTCLLTVLAGFVGCVLILLQVYELRMPVEDRESADDQRSAPNGAP